MIDKIAKYSTLAVPYSILVSIFYLFGYWSAFDIDFYSYISVQEIAIRSIAPFIYVGIVSFLGFFTSRDDEKNNKNYSKRINLVILFFALLLCLFIILFVNAYRFLAYSIIFITIITFYFRITKNKLLDNKFVFYLIILLPALSYFYGRTESEKIIKGVEYQKIAFCNNKQFFNINSQENRYIGKISEFLFIYIPSEKSTLVINYNESTPLIISKTAKHGDHKQKATAPTMPSP